jgi:hypothetical protein
MKKILVLQCDTRWDGKTEPNLTWDDQVAQRDFEFRKLNCSFFQWTDFVRLNVKLNSFIAEKNNWSYIYHTFSPSLNSTPHWQKIDIVARYLAECEWLVFLDTDAWIRDPVLLSSFIDFLIQRDYKGAFSREPYLLGIPFVNTGSFILKSTSKTLELWMNMIKEQEKILNRFEPPFEESLVAKRIYQNKSMFYICEPTLLNTPSGKILRHYWSKSEWMYKLMLEDLIAINECDQQVPDLTSINFELYKDKDDFPSQKKVRMKRFKRLKEWFHTMRKSFR